MARKRQTTGLPKVTPAKPTTPAGKEAESKTGIPASPATPGRRDGYRSRAEQDAKIQGYVRLATVIVGVVIVAMILVAVVVDGFIRPNEAVGKVNDQNITVGEFQQRVRLEHSLQIIRFSNALSQFAAFTGGDVNQAYQQLTQQEPYSTWASEVQSPDALANRVLNDMVDDKIIELAANELGITVSDEEIEEQINNFIGYDPEAVANIGVDPTETPTPTITPTPFVSPTPSLVPTETPIPSATFTLTALPEGSATAVDSQAITAVPTEVTPTLSATEVQGNFITRREELMKRLTSEARASEDYVRDFFRKLALRQKIAETVGTQPGLTTYVNSRHILVATQEEAQDVLTALQAGESFADLARAVSNDTGSGAQGGELGWTPAYQFVGPFAEAVKTGAIGEIIGPVETEFGYHIIQVRAREEREIDENQLEQAQQVDFQTWLEEQKTSGKYTTQTYNSWTSHVPRLSFTFAPF